MKIQNTVYKYPTKLDIPACIMGSGFHVEAPEDVSFNWVGLDGNKDICLWGIVDPDETEMVAHHFIVAPTGVAVGNHYTYFGSFEVPESDDYSWMIFHVWVITQ